MHFEKELIFLISSQLSIIYIVTNEEDRLENTLQKK